MYVGKNVIPIWDTSLIADNKTKGSRKLPTTWTFTLYSTLCPDVHHI